MGLEVSFQSVHSTADLTSDDSEFQVCGAATKQTDAWTEQCMKGTVTMRLMQHKTIKLTI